jgi:hypothetical protein
MVTMHTTLHSRNLRKDRHERGAALITMLLVAALILAAGGALIVSTATSAVNANDAVASKQAYYAAEAGLQMGLNVLRGNMAHDASVASGTQMNFHTAITPALSNGIGHSDSTSTCDNTAADSSRCRLAGWLPYDNPASSNGLVQVGNGSAFRLSVYDPDNSQNVTFSTSGTFTPALGLPVPAVLQNATTLLLGVAPNLIKIEYVPRASTTLMNATAPTATDFGSFRVTTLGLGVPLPLNLQVGTFDLKVNQTAPWAATTTFNTRIVSVGACPLMANVNFLQTAQSASGTNYTPNSDALALSCAMGGSTATAIAGSVLAPQPKQLVIRSLGFGPKWAQKRLELTLARNTFDFNAQSSVLLVSPTDGTNLPAANFDIGQSAAKIYSGNDTLHAGEVPSPALPVFATTSATDSATIKTIVDSSKPQTVTSASDKVRTLDPSSLPAWLQNPNDARTMLSDLKATAQSMGRYFNTNPDDNIPDSVPPDAGTEANPKVTFVDGDYDMSGNDTGGGLLIVTGRLTNNGNVGFSGLILVLGKGEVQRNGGGGGDLLGAIVVAAFDPDKPNTPFTTPFFHTNGGGSNTLGYDSLAVNNALGVLGSRTMGVLEF